MKKVLVMKFVSPNGLVCELKADLENPTDLAVLVNLRYRLLKKGWRFLLGEVRDEPIEDQ